MVKRARIPKIEVSAKAHAVAKASFERKKIITENIPEDVSRAKAGAWLTLLSPITEWAGLKGDALNFKRKLLRVQQEDTLIRIASKVREKLVDVEITRHIPRKILIPAIEKASLEEVDDDVMVDRWASLLASAAQDMRVQPRFVGILEELSGAQAKCLERVAFNRWEEFNYPATIFEDSSLDFSSHNVQRHFGPAIDGLLNADVRKIPPSDLDEAIASALEQRIIYGFCRPGVLLRSCFLTLRDEATSFYEIYDTVRDTGIRAHNDLSILESLGLIREVAFTCDVTVGGNLAEISLYYWHLTDLGVQFCWVCSSARVQEMEERGRKSSGKNLRSQNSLWLYETNES